MFNLEQSIADWRRQMLAAGIKTPVPLEELESHLREAIERQIRAGVEEEEAFDMAAQKIGSADALKIEFKKSGTCRRNTDSIKANHVLGVVWTVASLWPLIYLCGNVSKPLTFLNVLEFFFYSAMLFGGILLLRGSNVGRHVIRTLAMVLLVACAAQIVTQSAAGRWLVWCGLWAVVSLVTIVALHLPELDNATRLPKFKLAGITLVIGAIIAGANLQMYTNNFISVHRNGVHGAVIVHWAVFLVIALNFAGILCLVWPKKRQFNKSN